MRLHLPLPSAVLHFTCGKEYCGEERFLAKTFIKQEKSAKQPLATAKKQSSR